jgi:argininosuccinate lyase
MQKAQDFISSISFDMRLAGYDIIGSVAHVRMLAKKKIITAREGARIVNGLESILKDLRKGKSIPSAEDVHYAVEKELIKRIGPAGGKMHTARSRNDQVALDLRLYVRDETIELYTLIRDVQRAIVAVAEDNINTVMPGYTHLQHAQPVLFAHHLLAYAWMFDRDTGRLSDCLKRTNILPLGSAALAGTSFPIDRKYVAGLLGFSGVSDNSMDAVSDRDFAVEFIACLSVIAMHLSRLAEEFINWSSEEFGFIKIADEFTSGSSIMPQKRNPDVAELVRGKTGKVYGSLMSILTLMKGLPLAYNRDMQEDKPPVFDAVDAVKASLEVALPMILTVKVRKERMAMAASKGFLEATELADYLSKKGLPFRQAHGIVSNIVKYCIKNHKRLAELENAELAMFSKLFKKDVNKLLHVDNIVRAKTSEGGTSPASVKKQLAKLRSILK